MTPNASAIQRARRLSIAEGMLHAVMVGVGESFLGVLAVELGHGDTALALLVTVPMLCAGLVQFMSTPLARVLRSRKRLVVLGATTQAVAQIAFVAIAAFDVRGFWLLLIAKIIHWCSGAVIAPSWGAWMAGLTNDDSRARYFSFRTAATHSALLLSFVGAGLILREGERSGRAFDIFVGLFVVAFVARVASALMLASQYDPAPQPSRRADLVRTALKKSRWRTALYVAALTFGAYVAVPFFTPFMRRELALDYSTYSALIALPIAIRAVLGSFFHRWASIVGQRRLMVVSGLGISCVALLWSVNAGLETIFLAQALSGLSWGVFEYVSFQLLLDSSGARWRAEFLSIVGTLTGLAQVAGSLVGSTLLAVGHLTYTELFLVSAGARALPLIALLPILPMLPAVPVAIPRLFMRILSVRPAGGTTERPIVLNDPDDGA